MPAISKQKSIFSTLFTQRHSSFGVRNYDLVRRKRFKIYLPNDTFQWKMGMGEVPGNSRSSVAFGWGREPQRDKGRRTVGMSRVSKGGKRQGQTHELKYTQHRGPGAADRREDCFCQLVCQTIYHTALKGCY